MDCSNLCAPFSNFPQYIILFHLLVQHIRQGLIFQGAHLDISNADILRFGLVVRSLGAVLNRVTPQEEKHVAPWHARGRTWLLTGKDLVTEKERIGTGGVRQHQVFAWMFRTNGRTSAEGHLCSSEFIIGSVDTVNKCVLTSTEFSDLWGER